MILFHLVDYRKIIPLQLSGMKQRQCEFRDIFDVDFNLESCPLKFIDELFSIIGNHYA